MAFRWFTIEKISRLEKRSKSDDDRVASNWRSWSQGFIVDITIKSGRDHHVRVDAFPLLYEFLNAVVSFCTKRQFDLEIGEGIALQGALSEECVDIAITFEAGGRSDILGQHSLSAQEAMLFVTCKVGEIVRCFEDIDVNVEASLLRFPMSGYQRARL